MREHSDWPRVILGYKSVQIFHSAMIFYLKCPHTRPIVPANVPKRYISLGLTTTILNSTDKGKNRPRNT